MSSHRLKAPTLAALAALLLAAGATWWAIAKRANVRGPAQGSSATDDRAADATTGRDAGSKTRARPNVVLISLDTLRADHLGCFGYGRPTSPNLDRLARQATVLTNCRAQAPWTLPSHMSLLTSMLPSSNRVTNLNSVLPAGTLTLAQALSDAGYHTAALVNNGQMRAHWGFNRGFDTWQEFEVDMPESDCEHLTDAALQWLEKRAHQSEKPFFLFLHYYDAHDPYFAAEPFRRLMGASLTAEEARALTFANRTPQVNKLDKKALAGLIAAYDAEIAWLDNALGRLIKAIGPDTILVIFSDHGEAFEEHGWTAHGATLYEEEIHVPLIMRLPGRQPARVDVPVMLLDVAPTIVAACGIEPLAEFQGSDLADALNGKPQPPRLIPSETKAVLEGQARWAVAVGSLKLMYSLFDGRLEMYRLPDEKTNLVEKERAALAALQAPLAKWVNSEQFWTLHAVGSGDFEVEVECAGGGFSLFIPAGLDESRDNFDVSSDGRKLSWRVYADRSRPKTLLVETADPAAPLSIDVKINGRRAADQVWMGTAGTHPRQLPVTLDRNTPPLAPLSVPLPAMSQDGLHVFLRRGATRAPRPAKFSPLDERTIEQLRSLGYVK